MNARELIRHLLEYDLDREVRVAGQSVVAVIDREDRKLGIGLNQYPDRNRPKEKKP